MKGKTGSIDRTAYYQELQAGDVSALVQQRDLHYRWSVFLETDLLRSRYWSCG
ncbi:hypothetical protein ACNKHT_24675 [Shigella flexneri]